jgi:hypothetical protein
LIVTALGCEGLVEVDAQERAHQLAVYAFPSPDAPLSVRVSRTAGASERLEPGELLAVEGARVTAEIDGARYVLVEATPGVFTTAVIPRVGDVVRVEADAPGFEPVRGETTIPERPRFALEDITTTFARTVLLANFDLVVRDRSGPDWYRFGIFTPRPPGTPGDGGPWIAASLASTDPLLRASPGLVGTVDVEYTASTYDTAWFSDSGFEDRTRRFPIRAEIFVGDKPPDVVLTAMTREYFEYHRTLELQGRFDEDPLADPVDVFTNVEGGVGAVAGYANTVASIRPN